MHHPAVGDRHRTLMSRHATENRSHEILQLDLAGLGVDRTDLDERLHAAGVDDSQEEVERCPLRLDVRRCTTGEQPHPIRVLALETAEHDTLLQGAADRIRELHDRLTNHLGDVMLVPLLADLDPLRDELVDQRGAGQVDRGDVDRDGDRVVLVTVGGSDSELVRTGRAGVGGVAHSAVVVVEGVSLIGHTLNTDDASGIIHDQRTAGGHATGDDVDRRIRHQDTVGLVGTGRTVGTAARCVRRARRQDAETHGDEQRDDESDDLAHARRHNIVSPFSRMNGGATLLFVIGYHDVKICTILTE